MAIKTKKIIEVIKKGGAVVCPTDTVYGLIADATNDKAVERIFKIKKRERSKFLPIFVKDIKMAKKFAYINKDQEKILREKWPGKFTFVLKRKKAKIFGVDPVRDSNGREKAMGEQISNGVDKKTIALRIPDYKLVNTLLKKLNKPLTGTSANISGKPASTKIKEVLKQFKKNKIKPDLVIDAGNLPKNKPSKVVDLTKKEKKVLRY